MHLPADNMLLNFLTLFASFYILAKSADFLVDGAVGVAVKARIDKVIIGIVLVGFATTAPEFTVSLMSAIRGFPEIALGNAIGSVIVDDGVALALAILLAPKAITINPRVLKRVGLFLVVIDLFAFGLALNGVISRLEGIMLLIILAGYLIVLVNTSRKNAGLVPPPEDEIEEHIKPGTLGKQLLLFFIGVAGVIIASEFLVSSSLNIARFFQVPEVIIGLTIIAIGTSLPEIATCITAARKGHGDLAFGDIIGADILNILWIVGAAAAANTIQVATNVIYFAFPSMIIIVVTMLLLARHKYRLHRWKGVVLLLLYVVYLVSMVLFFYVPGRELPV
ncbi:calcium/sodium antiporter [Marispirochaeta sp.]|uniref:calcium/sodium antiporter n=1 Tax=Marispirochaeta sp. TaxID=2038653 RepID=UPI0029C72EA0|nr:calcium/sodium antiporter [Marispirochaeta sp.]